MSYETTNYLPKEDDVSLLKDSIKDIASCITGRSKHPGARIIRAVKRCPPELMQELSEASQDLLVKKLPISLPSRVAVPAPLPKQM
jgi:hypothetical protein